MDYLKVVNLEKYQHYKERHIAWIKWYIESVNDYKFSQLTDEQRWIFIGMIGLACRTENKIPFDYSWISKQISSRIDTKNDIDVLIAINLLSKCYQSDSTMLSTIRIDIEKNRIDNKQIKVKPELPVFTLTSQEILNYWNSKAELPKVMKITKQRAVKLKERLKEPVFASKYKAIIDIICQSDFLTGRKPGKDHDNWKASFDWLIHNDTNYTKILEGKYNNKENTVKKPQLYIHQGVKDIISRQEHYKRHPEEYVIPEIENKYKPQPEANKKTIEERNTEIEQAKIKARELLSQLGIKNNV